MNTANARPYNAGVAEILTGSNQAVAHIQHTKGITAMRIRLRPALALLVCTATVAPASNAAEWKIDPRVELRAGYNDNIRLTVDDELSSPEYILNPGTLFSYETPTSGISGDVDLAVRRYTDESDLDDENGRLRVASFRRMERSELGLKLDVVKDTTLDSQLENPPISGVPVPGANAGSRTSMSIDK